MAEEKWTQQTPGTREVRTAAQADECVFHWTATCFRISVVWWCDRHFRPRISHNSLHFFSLIERFEGNCPTGGTGQRPRRNLIVSHCCCAAVWMAGSGQKWPTVRKHHVVWWWPTPQVTLPAALYTRIGKKTTKTLNFISSFRCTFMVIILVYVDTWTFYWLNLVSGGRR